MLSNAYAKACDGVGGRTGRTWLSGQSRRMGVTRCGRPGYVLKSFPRSPWKVQCFDHKHQAWFSHNAHARRVHGAAAGGAPRRHACGTLLPTPDTRVRHEITAEPATGVRTFAATAIACNASIKKISPLPPGRGSSSATQATITFPAATPSLRATGALPAFCPAASNLSQTRPIRSGTLTPRTVTLTTRTTMPLPTDSVSV